MDHEKLAEEKAKKDLDEWKINMLSDIIRRKAATDEAFDLEKKKILASKYVDWSGCKG